MSDDAAVDDSEDSKAREVTAEAVGDALATGAGLLLGGAVAGPAGAIAGAAAAPYAAWAALAISEKVFPRRNESPVRLIAQTADVLGVDGRGVEELASSSDAKLEMAGEAIWAAWHTLNEQKIQALALALANGLSNDDARVEEERLVIAALAEMEAPHVKLLGFLGRNPGFARSPESLYFVVRECPGFTKATAGAVMVALERSHCVERTPPDLESYMRKYERTRTGGKYRGVLPPRLEEPKFRVTDFGEKCLTYLRSRPRPNA